MRKFDARFSRLDEHRRRFLKEAPGRAIASDEHLDVIEDHLSVTLRRRDAPYALFKAQMSMLVDLIDYEKAASHYKKEIEALAARAEDASGDSMTREHLEGLHAEHAKYRSLCRGIRDIGDGIAWRVLGYDRAVLNVLAGRARKQHINPEGLEAELREFAQAFNENSVAVFNDLTHFLKRGDLLVKRSPDLFELVEVKSSKASSGSIKRQRRDLQSTVEFLTTGVRPNEKPAVTFLELDVVPENYVANVGRLLEEAGKNGVAVSRIAEHLVVVAVDYRTDADLEEERVRAILAEAAMVLEKWDTVKEFHLEFRSTDRYAEVRHHSPWSIFPLHERDRVRLAVGTVELRSHFNVSEVLRYLQRQGWQVTRGVEETAAALLESDEEHGIRVSKGPLTVELPMTLLARLGSEFLRPRTILSALNALLVLDPPKSELSLLTFRGESEQWD